MEKAPPFQRGFGAIDQQQNCHNQHDGMANIQRLLWAPLLTRNIDRGQRHHHQHNRHVDQKTDPSKNAPAAYRQSVTQTPPRRPDRGPDAKRDVAISRVNKQGAYTRKVAGMIIAAPIASEARAAISQPAEGAKAAASDDRPNSVLPSISSRLKTDAVAERAHWQHHTRHHQRVNIDDPQ